MWLLDGPSTSQVAHPSGDWGRGRAPSLAYCSLGEFLTMSLTLLLLRQSALRNYWEVGSPGRALREGDSGGALPHSLGS